MGGLSVGTDVITCARRCGAVCPAQNAKLYKRPASEQVLRTPTPGDSVVERKKNGCVCQPSSPRWLSSQATAIMQLTNV